jgi:hypothetical protein
MVWTFTYLKIFEQLEHANALIRGKLFMNTLDYFRAHEEGAAALRGDPFEGVSGLLQPSELSGAGYSRSHDQGERSSWSLALSAE